MDPSNFETFIAQQKARGALDGSGIFTIDESKARLKLAQFQFDDAAAYLLKFVQAGVLLGARIVRLQCSEKEVGIIYESPTGELVCEEVIQLIQDPLKSEAGKRFPQLGSALTGAPAESIVFEEPRGERITIDKSGLRRESLAEPTPDRISFRLTRPVKERNAEVRAVEAKTLSERCDLSPVTVVVDGLKTAVSRPTTHFYRSSHQAVEGSQSFVLAEKHHRLLKGYGVSPPEVRPEPAVTYVDGKRSVTGQSLPNMLVQVRDHPEPERDQPDQAQSLVLLSNKFQGGGRLHLVQLGVTLEVLNLNLGCPGAVAALCVDGMETDLSGLKVRQCEELTEAIEGIRRQVKELVGLAYGELPSLHLLLTDGWYSFTGAVLGGMAGGMVGLFGGLTGALLGIVKGSAAGGGAAWAWNKATRANLKVVDRCRAFLEQHLRDAHLTVPE